MGWGEEIPKRTYRPPSTGVVVGSSDPDPSLMGHPPEDGVWFERHGPPPLSPPESCETCRCFLPADESVYGDGRASCRLDPVAVDVVSNWWCSRWRPTGDKP